MLVYTLASPVLSQQVMFTTIFLIKQVKDASAFCCFEPGREIREFALLISRAYIPVAGGVFADFLFRGIDDIGYRFYFSSVTRAVYEDIPEIGNRDIHPSVVSRGNEIVLRECSATGLPGSDQIAFGDRKTVVPGQVFNLVHCGELPG